MKTFFLTLCFCASSLILLSQNIKSKNKEARETPAQSAPWSAQPIQKKVMDINGDETTVFLSRDTLHNSVDTPFDRLATMHWYKSNTNLVGYGYRDRLGKPYGIWKYYLLSEKKWDLFCEGYYGMVDANRLQVDPDIKKRFPASFTAEAKDEFVKGLKDRLLFTGEWRFYVEGRLHKILVLDNMVSIPYLISDSMDGTVTLLLSDDQRWRMIGTILAECQFSPSGQVKKMWTRDLSMDFDNNGQPKIYPLPDMD